MRMHVYVTVCASVCVTVCASVRMHAYMFDVCLITRSMYACIRRIGPGQIGPGHIGSGTFRSRDK